jgi:hypothetical protein
MIEIILLISYIISSKILLILTTNDIILQLAEVIHITLLLDFLKKYIRKRTLIKIVSRNKKKIVLFLVGVLILTYDILLGIKYLLTPYYLPGDAYSYYIFVLILQGHSKVMFQPNYFVENIIIPSMISQVMNPYIVFGYFVTNFFLQFIGVSLIYKALNKVNANQVHVRFLTILLFLFLFTIPPPANETIYLKIYRIFPDLWGYEYYKLFAIYSTFLVAYLIFRKKAVIGNEVAPLFITSLIFFYPHYGIITYIIDLIFFGKNDKLLIYSLVELAILYITNVTSGFLFLLASSVLLVLFTLGYKIRKITLIIISHIINTFKNATKFVVFCLILTLFVVNIISKSLFPSLKNVGIVDPSTWFYIDLPLVLIMYLWNSKNTNGIYRLHDYDYFIISMIIMQIIIYALSNIPITFVQSEALSPYKSITLFYLLIIVITILKKQIPKKYIILYLNAVISVTLLNWIIYYISYLSYFPTLGNNNVNLQIVDNIIKPLNNSYYVATKDVPLWHLFLFVDSKSLAIHPYAYNQNLTLFAKLMHNFHCFNITFKNQNYIYFSVNYNKCQYYIILGYGTLVNNVFYSKSPIMVVISNDKLLHLRNFPIVKFDNITSIAFLDRLYIVVAKNFNILGYGSAFISYDFPLLLLSLLHLFILLFLTFSNILNFK